MSNALNFFKKNYTEIVKFVTFPNSIHAFACRNKFIYINLQILQKNSYLNIRLKSAAIIVMLLHETMHYFRRYFLKKNENEDLLFSTPKK